MNWAVFFLTKYGAGDGKLTMIFESVSGLTRVSAATL